MQLPITIGLHRSRLLGRALLFLATLGIVIFCTLPRSTALGMGFSLMLMLLSVRAWRAIDAGPVG
ncbi:MAG: hypothetical protein L6Q40_11320, partial [Azonexus sp.]|nr:hypothetical protein [Azonexus sp.]